MRMRHVDVQRLVGGRIEERHRAIAGEPVLVRDTPQRRADGVDAGVPRSTHQVAR